MTKNNKAIHREPLRHPIPKEPPAGFKKVHGHYGKSTVYTNKKVFISADLDQHNGGYWKVAKKIEDLWKRETRMGTYNEDLIRIGD